MVVRGVENLAEFLNKYQTKRGSKTQVVDTGISPRMKLRLQKQRCEKYRMPTSLISLSLPNKLSKDPPFIY